MTPKFTTPCFIRKNTPELCKKLEKLGYTILFSARNGYGNGLCAFYGYVTTFDSTTIHDAIDCEDSEDLFLALAALREDGDRFQWFVLDEPHETYSKFVLCELEDWDSDFYSWSNDDDMFPYMYHKATPSELIRYFKI